MKLISKIASLSVGLALAVGVGVAVGSKEAKVVKAEGKITTLAGISSGTKYYIGATVSDTDYYWCATGGVEVGTGLSGTAVSSTSEATPVILSGSDSIWSLQFENGNYLSLATSKANGKYNVVSDAVNFTISEVSSLLKIAIDSTYCIQLNTGTKSQFGSYNGGQTNVWLEEAGSQKTLVSLAVSGSMTKTEYTTAEAWDPSGLTVMGTYDTSDVVDVTNSVTWSYNPSAPAVSVTSVVATASIGTVSGSSSAQAVTVTEAPANPGTEDNPYTVAQARAAIDAGSGTSNVYATGIVSEIVTVYSSKYLNVTFNFSDDGTKTSPQLQAFREKSSYSSTVKVGDIVVVSGTLTKYGSTYEFGANCAISSLTEPTGTKYSVTGNINHGELNVSEILEKTALSVNVVPEVGYYYPETLSSVKVGGVDVAYSYENGVVSIAADKITGNVTISGTCVACNPLKSLYARPAGYTSGTVYGYYVGFLTGSGPIIMDGEYGILLYGKSESDVSGYTSGTTILSVSGTVDHYNGLGQIKNSTIEEASGEFVAPATPVVYAAKGGETEEYANRLTTVTGVPTVTKGDITKEAGTTGNDITLSFDLGGGKSIQVFFKVAGQSADTDAYAALQSAVSDSSEITVKGFTGWYNGFQVQMNGYIAPAESYTAEDFAQDLLDQTDAVCTGWKEGDNNHDALEAIWSNLASNDKYPSLPSEQKTILAEANRDESGTVVEQAMARYDFLTGKYNLSNFINGRTPIVPAGRIDFSSDISQNSSMIIIVAIAATSALAFTMLLVFKKKKQK